MYGLLRVKTAQRVKGVPSSPICLWNSPLLPRKRLRMFWLRFSCRTSCQVVPLCLTIDDLVSPSKSVKFSKKFFLNSEIRPQSVKRNWKERPHLIFVLCQTKQQVLRAWNVGRMNSMKLDLLASPYQNHDQTTIFSERETPFPALTLTLVWRSVHDWIFHWFVFTSIFVFLVNAAKKTEVEKPATSEGIFPHMKDALKFIWWNSFFKMKLISIVSTFYFNFSRYSDNSRETSGNANLLSRLKDCHWFRGHYYTKRLSTLFFENFSIFFLW